MISKVICAPVLAFNAGCKYLFKEGKDAKIISSQGVRHDPALMASDFSTYASQQPNKSKCVMFHGIISFPQSEKISDLLAYQISTAYLNKLGFKNSAQVVVCHRDRQHFHLHCLSSFTDMNGNSVNDSWIGLRAKKIAQALTKEYNLTPAIKKNYTQTNFKALRNDDTEKYKLHSIISTTLKISKSIHEFERLLKEKNIEIQYKTRRGTDEIQGISFKSNNGDFCFKGSEIDRNLSYNRILQSIELNIPHQVNISVEQQSESKSSVISNFLSAFGGGGSSYSGGIFPTHTPSHNPNFDDEDEIKKKKKKKRKYIDLSI